MSLVEIPLDDLLNVLPFKARDDIRYFLNGVLVSPCGEGAMLVATNGHVMAVLHSRNAHTDVDRILDIPDDFAKALRHQGNQGQGRTLSVETETARIVITAEDVEHLVKAGRAFLDGKYPEWRKVVPKVEELEPGFTSALSSEYLAWLQRATAYGKSVPIMFWQRKEKPLESVAVARFSGIPELVVLVMPMRIDRPTEWPDWMPHDVPTEAAA